ncbi:glycoside hydrolase family 5 protein [Biscogniauxia mediterranea]|nr:glycoside hydrolase family 5 protein [Biscogniauxia mediterranea]
MLCSPSATLWLALASVSTVKATVTISSADTHILGRRWLPSNDKIRGVNLGSQFIVEEWFARDEWASMGCKGFYDEWSCVEALGQQAADAAFDKHWNTWITQDDISEMARYGLNTIRVPVGFWIKEDLVYESEHYPRGGLKYLDRLVGWAADAGLYVIMDLHGAPGSQTGKDEFTGHSVDVPGFFTPENYERACQFLEWMAERIHTNNAYRSVGMLEVMNEPIKHRANATDSDDMVKNFYPAAWDRIRARESELHVAGKDLLHIQFMARGSNWGSGRAETYLNDTTFIYYDEHSYLKFDTRVNRTKDGYIEGACTLYSGESNAVVGEFSLGVAHEVQSNDELGIRNNPGNAAWYRKYFAAQVGGYERGGGWVFWSWKCNWMGGFNDWRWCYKYAVEAGAIPNNASTAAFESPC